jgi:hypothetical protein
MSDETQTINECAAIVDRYADKLEKGATSITEPHQISLMADMVGFIRACALEIRSKVE